MGRQGSQKGLALTALRAERAAEAEKQEASLGLGETKLLTSPDYRKGTHTEAHRVKGGSKTAFLGCFLPWRFSVLFLRLS